MRNTKNLKAERKARGWTQAHVAVLAQVGIGDVSRIENEVLRPSLQQAEKLARVFGASVEELFGEQVRAAKREAIAS